MTESLTKHESESEDKHIWSALAAALDGLEGIEGSGIVAGDQMDMMRDMAPADAVLHVASLSESLGIKSDELLRLYGLDVVAEFGETE